MKILYIEGFSPGPGLPYPILTFCMNGIEIVEARMPYGFKDHIANPYLWVLLIGTVGIFLVWLPWIITTKMTLGLKSFLLTILTILLLCGLWFLKKKTVEFCLKTCVIVFKDAILKEKPDIVIGYSWGGGILTMLLHERHWEGPSIIIASAGKLMASTAGIEHQIDLENVSDGVRITIIHGTEDNVAPFVDSEKLFRSTNIQARNCGDVIFHVIQGGDHFLRQSVTKNFFLYEFERMDLLR